MFPQLLVETKNTLNCITGSVPAYLLRVGATFVCSCYFASAAASLFPWVPGRALGTLLRRLVVVNR